MEAERQNAGSAGLSIAGRFSLFCGLALLVVMSAAGYFLLDKSRVALEQAGRQTLNTAASYMAAENEASGELIKDLLRDVKFERIEMDEAVRRLQSPLGERRGRQRVRRQRQRAWRKWQRAWQRR